MQNNPSEYLERFSDSGSIMLVGPLADAELEIIEPVIFVDGGSTRREHNIGLSVGDGDSFAGELDHKLDTEKDFSDLAFALSLLSHGFHNIEMHGFLGGRRDHELLNLGEVFHFLARRTRPATALIDRSVDAFSEGSWQVEVHGTFSLIAFEAATVALSGRCRYQIPDGTRIAPVSSFGLSNEGYGLITIKTSSPLFLFRNKEA